jgi:hypothetical protein
LGEEAERSAAIDEDRCRIGKRIDTLGGSQVIAENRFGIADGTATDSSFP